MFSGIIEATADILKKTPSTLTIERPKVIESVKIGASIAISGVCLSVVEYDEEALTFDVVAETWQKSKLGSLKEGDRVNIERAVQADGRLDGHIVQGHVEGVGKWRVEDGKWFIELPKDLIKFCVQKGSIALDGVSLTIASVDAERVEVALVPHTLENTTLGTLKTGDPVNIETDVLGRYLYAFSHEDTVANQ